MSAVPTLRRTFPTAGRLAPARLSAAVQSRQARAAADLDAGMTTAEYAVGTVAACGFGGILFKIITSDTVINLLKEVITKAFHLDF